LTRAIVHDREDQEEAAIHGCTSQFMNKPIDKPDETDRRAAARRTALVVGIIAIAIFVLSILGVWLNG